jgi:hypothetical protein
MGNVVRQAGAALRDAGLAAAPSDRDAAERVVLRLLRVERAVDARERDIVAGPSIARGEIEGHMPQQAPPVPAAPQSAAADEKPAPRENGDGREQGATPDAGGLDLSDLWGEPKD